MKNIPFIDQDISQLHSIAANLSKEFKKININTINDLLWYFPFRYDDLSDIKNIEDLEEGGVVTIKVKVYDIKTYRSFKKRMIITKMIAKDETDSIEVIWFRQKFVGKVLKPNDEIYLSGKVQKKHLLWQFINPVYEKVKDKPLHSARLVPIYHLSGKLTQKQLRFLIDRALKQVKEIDDPLPVDLLNKEKYPWLYQSLQAIHFPEDDNILKQAIQRLKFQELFYLQCKYQLAKDKYQKQDSYIIKKAKKEIDDIINKLPFTLTKDQDNTLEDIFKDMSKKHPMNRLVEGDVGSGKTIVAFLAMINSISKNLQTAMIAPTEILAQQHYNSLKQILPKKYINKVAILTKSNQYLGDKEIKKKELTNKLNKGDILLVIGTHALIQENINFNNLSLVVIDEQHRFGVKQRQDLKNKNKDKKVPHLLSMTATPIPRTLSLTLYGDLDISLIKEKPKGRKDIKTFLVPENKRKDAYQFIKEKIELNQQVFIICPLIEESDKLGVKSVIQEYKKLNKDIFPDLEIKFLHGKLKSEEKKKIMEDFKNNNFPMLISTSVIEVGVDIPNATTMIIESSERFGLSQLHQFRGRIGRNELDSFCLLFTTDKSKFNTQRLKALTKTNDGFKLAELDLELRGSGEIFGTQQTGLMKLNIAKLSDTEIIKKAQKWAQEIINNTKYLSQKQLQDTLKKLKTEMHLE